MKNKTHTLTLSIRPTGETKHQPVISRFETVTPDITDGVRTYMGAWVQDKDHNMVEDIINNGITAANEVVNCLVETQNEVARECFNEDRDCHTTKLETFVGRTPVSIVHSRSGDITVQYNPCHEVADTIISAWGDMVADNFYMEEDTE